MRTQGRPLGRPLFCSRREMAAAFRAVLALAVVALGLFVGSAAMAQVVINPGAIPAGTVGLPYNQNFSASGGAAPYAFSNEVGRLPNVLTLTPSGTLSGTPQPPTVPFEIWATDADGRESRANSSAWVSSYALTLSASFPTAFLNQAYSVSVTVSGGTAPYACSLFSGALPTGLSAASNCVVSGTPSTTGTYTFTLQATDSVTGVGNQAFTVTVINGSQAPLTVLSTTTTPTVGTTALLSTAGGSGTGAVTYASNNTNCAVNGNILFAAAVGSCTVTATKAADTTHLAATATLNITVRASTTVVVPPPTGAAIPALTVPPGCGLVAWPPIVNVSAGQGPAFVADMVAMLSNALGVPLRFVEQTTCGSVILAGYNAGNLAFIAHTFQAGDGRLNGIYPVGNGQYQVVQGGQSLVIAPALAHVEQLSNLLPGAATSQGESGVLTTTVNGATYVVLPSVAVQLDAPIGRIQLLTGSDSYFHFIDAFGNEQVLYPALEEPATVRGILQGMDAAATLNVGLDGNAAIVFNAQHLTLVPDITLGAIPTDRTGQAWWQESATRYRVVNVQAQPAPGTSQGFTVKP